ncbi:MAG TPA: SRPBCC family protein [Nitriliruptorales bacterium]|nr:SRPBCC family protein [Nitriliruptorales bacterium]
MDGILERSDGQVRLRFTRRLPHPPQAVWRALTEPDDLAAWFPASIQGAWQPGATLRFTFRDPDEAAEVLGVDEAPVLDGRVIAYEPYTRLEYTWEEDTLRFDLEPDGDGTILRLTVTFDEIGRAARDAAGWHECLDLLAHRLAGERPTFAPGERWSEVHGGYVERFGPDASTIGPPESDA